MAIETIANLTGQFDQFGKRVERLQTDSDNIKRELTDAINGLRADNQAFLVRIDGINSKMDAGFQDLRGELKQEIQSAKQEFGNTRNWQISCLIAAVIATCAVVGLLFQ